MNKIVYRFLKNTIKKGEFMKQYRILSYVSFISVFVIEILNAAQKPIPLIGTTTAETQQARNVIEQILVLKQTLQTKDIPSLKQFIDLLSKNIEYIKQNILNETDAKNLKLALIKSINDFDNLINTIKKDPSLTIENRIHFLSLIKDIIKTLNSQIPISESFSEYYYADSIRELLFGRKIEQGSPIIQPTSPPGEKITKAEKPKQPNPLEALPDWCQESFKKASRTGILDIERFTYGFITDDPYWLETLEKKSNEVDQFLRFVIQSGINITEVHERRIEEDRYSTQEDIYTYGWDEYLKRHRPSLQTPAPISKITPAPQEASHIDYKEKRKLTPQEIQDEMEKVQQAQQKVLRDAQTKQQLLEQQSKEKKIKQQPIESETVSTATRKLAAQELGISAISGAGEGTISLQELKLQQAAIPQIQEPKLTQRQANTIKEIESKYEISNLVQGLDKKYLSKLIEICKASLNDRKATELFSPTECYYTFKFPSYKQDLLEKEERGNFAPEWLDYYYACYLLGKKQSQYPSLAIYYPDTCHIKNYLRWYAIAYTEMQPHGCYFTSAGGDLFIKNGFLHQVQEQDPVTTYPYYLVYYEFMKQRSTEFQQDTIKNFAKELVKFYKIHLMPQEKPDGDPTEIERIFIKLLKLIQKNETLQKGIYTMKIKVIKTIQQPERPPRIVLYVYGKQNAQNVIDTLWKEFDEKNYPGLDQAPGFNEKVTSLIFFAQGDRDFKQDNMPDPISHEIHNYEPYYETPQRIYYHSLITGEYQDYHLKNPNPAYQQKTTTAVSSTTKLDETK